MQKMRNQLDQLVALYDVTTGANLASGAKTTSGGNLASNSGGNKRKDFDDVLAERYTYLYIYIYIYMYE